MALSGCAHKAPPPQVSHKLQAIAAPARNVLITTQMDDELGTGQAMLRTSLGQILAACGVRNQVVVLQMVSPDLTLNGPSATEAANKAAVAQKLREINPDYGIEIMQTSYQTKSSAGQQLTGMLGLTKKETATVVFYKINVIRMQDKALVWSAGEASGTPGIYGQFREEDGTKTAQHIVKNLEFDGLLKGCLPEDGKAS